MSNVSLINLKTSDTTTLQRLLQLYYFDSTSWSKEDIGIDALYDGSTASDLEFYVNSQEAKAYLIWVNEVLIGFVLLEWVEDEKGLSGNWPTSLFFLNIAVVGLRSK